MGHGQVGPGDAKGMVMANVNLHEGHLRHVAGHTLAAFSTDGMVMVFWPVEARQLVTLCAQAITRQMQFERMRVMAIRAADAGLGHAALSILDPSNRDTVPHCG